MNDNSTRRDPVKLTLLLIAVTTLIRFVIAGTTGLGTGEAYYARGALDLQLSYFDQPPLFLWLSGFSTKIFGLSNLALRLPALLFFIGTQWLLFLIARHFFNSWSGFFAVLILNLSFVFTVPVAAWFQPDAPLIFFWLLSCFFLVKLFFPNDAFGEEQPTNNKNAYLWWVCFGVSLGLTVLSKYHAILLVAGAFIYAALDRRQRYWFRHPGPYLAMVIALLISLPVIIWNYENDWISFTFQGSRAGSGQSFELRPDRFLRSVVGQSLWLAPWLWFPLIKQLIVSFKKRKIEYSHAFIFSMAVLPIVLFTTVSLWSRTGYHFHWQAPGYLMLFMPLGAAAWDRLSTGGRTRLKTRRWLLGSAIATIFLSALLLVHTETGIWRTYGPSYLIEKTIGERDPTIEGTDYDEIEIRFEQEGWLAQDSLFLGSTRWWQTGK
ncbi:MAG: glycosyltransferase family 39 protein, partial [Cyclobacteriaceae bacterium]